MRASSFVVGNAGILGWDRQEKNNFLKYSLPILILFLRLMGSLGFWAGIGKKKNNFSKKLTFFRNI
jgi:hypothetical protein